MVNVEADVLAGPLLAEEARKRVRISRSERDLPTADLHGEVGCDDRNGRHLSPHEVNGHGKPRGDLWSSKAVIA